MCPYSCTNTQCSMHRKFGLNRPNINQITNEYFPGRKYSNIAMATFQSELEPVILLHGPYNNTDAY